MVTISWLQKVNNDIGQHINGSVSCMILALQDNQKRKQNNRSSSKNIYFLDLQNGTFCKSHFHFLHFNFFLSLSHLVGASVEDENGLKFLYENDEDFTPLPTFSVVPSQAVMFGGNLWSNIPGWTVDLTKVEKFKLVLSSFILSLI